MKTIYLKSATKTALIADIAQVIEGYEGNIEFSNGTVHGHWIGQIPNETNAETGEVISWIDGYHANLLVPQEFDTTILKTIVTPPNSPVHGFA
jgi:hypothetical protein